MTRFSMIGSLGSPPAARFIAPATMLAVAGLLLMLAGAWRMAMVSDENELAWAVATAVCIVAGFGTLGWLRPARVAMTAPQLMLLLGAAGMVAGLWHDAQGGGVAALASLCLAGPGDFLGTLNLHWQQLPAMHVGMIAGGLATVPLLRAFRRGCRRQFCARLAQNLACSAWMVAGMAACLPAWCGVWW